MNAGRMLVLVTGVVGLAGCVHPRGVDVNVRASGEIAPGVYGRVDLRNRPSPPLLHAQPVVIVRQPVAVAPVYMHVPPGHARNWSKHCGKYDACGVPVYFVRSAEHEPGYVRPKKERGRGKGRDDDDDD
jgi:hypothetical protein